MKTIPLPEGIDAPKEGWAYAGQGPLKGSMTNRPRHDVAAYIGTEWDYGRNFSGSDDNWLYAVRIGSEIAKLNGFVEDEPQPNILETIRETLVETAMRIDAHIDSQPLSELFGNVRAWGLSRGITGPGGKGTPIKQADKMLEEVMELRDAIVEKEQLLSIIASLPPSTPQSFRDELQERLDAVNLRIIDGIGDVFVTGILEAAMQNTTAEYCLAHAYGEIKGRTGEMVGGQFVRVKEVVK